MKQKAGKAIIITAPSGAGKSSIVNALLIHNPKLAFSVSSTTRQKRAHEKDGIHYYFLTQEEFTTNIASDQFLEWEEVYEGKRYGTLKKEVQRIWDMGKVVVFDVDVKGAERLKTWFGHNALSLFIKPPSMNALRKRLSDRNTESKTSLAERMERAKMEMEWENRFDKIIVNDQLREAVMEAQEHIDKFIA